MSNFNITINKIEISNIRKIEHLVLETPSKYNFFQMQNGYGKTTTLTLLRHVFTGTLPSKEEVLDFKYNGSEEIEDPEHGYFKVTFNFDGDIYEIKINFYFKPNNPSASFFTSSPMHKGMRSGWRPPLEFVHRFRNKKDFVELFIFNGELAKELNKSQGVKIVKNSILQVTNLHYLYAIVRGSPEVASDQNNDNKQNNNADKDQNKINLLLDKVWRDALNDLSVKYRKVGKGIDKVRDYLSATRETITLREKEQEEIEIRLDEISNISKSIQDQIKDLLIKSTNRSEDIEKLEFQFHESESKLKEVVKSTIDDLLNPHLIINHIPHFRSFYSQIRKKKIPKSVGKSFFEEIIQSGTCVCGCELGSKEREHLERNKQDYLGDEILVLVKSMQSSIFEEIDVGPIDELREGILEAFLTYNRSRTELEDLKIEMLEKDGSDLQVEVRELESKIDFLNRERFNLEKELEDITSTNRAYIKSNKLDSSVLKANGEPFRDIEKIKSCKNLKVLRQVKEKFENKIKELDEAKTVEVGYEVIKDTINIAIDKLMGEILETINTEVNNSFSKLHAIGGDHFKGSHTLKVGEGITILDPSGERMTDVNHAAQLAAAYSYIHAMYKIGNINVPLIIDSPVTSFGLGVADNFSNVILSNQFSQVIGFITSMEKMGLKKFLRDHQDINKATVVRSGEGVDGKNAKGLLVLNYDEKFFFDYEVPEDKIT